jgi:hypothetical protein
MMSIMRKTNIGDKLIEDFNDVFANYSIDNRMYGLITLHVAFGQALCQNVYYRMGSRKIDIRVHLLLIKPQATGKGAGFSVCEKLADNLGLQFQSLTTSTDAGLVGTKIYDHSQKEEIIVDGLLKTADIIGMEEASMIFDLASDFSKKNMTLMQITMNSLWDSSCIISKKLGTTLIEFKPHASFLLTSYPPDNLAEKVMKTGFLDRVIPIFETVSLEQRLSTLKKMTELLNKPQGELNDKEQGVIETLCGIVNFYKKGEHCIEISENIHQKLLYIIEEFAMKVLDASPKAQEKLEHFVTRLYEILIKLSIHYALFNLRTRVEISDLLYARRIYLPIWKSLIVNIESLLIIDPSERARRNKIIHQSLQEYDKLLVENKYVKEKVWVRRLSMLPSLQQKWDNCSKETADNNLRKLEKNLELDTDNFRRIARLEEKDKFFETKEIGGFTYIKKIRDIK